MTDQHDVSPELTRDPVLPVIGRSADNSTPESAQTELDRRLTPVMFVLASTWLALLGAAIHLLADDAKRFDQAALDCLLAVFILTPLFALEGLLHRYAKAGQLRQHVWFTLFPPLRLGGRDHVDGGTIWIPLLGWRRATDRFEAELERSLSVPMIVVALLVLPVIGVEYLAAERVSSDWRVGLVTQLAGAAIWFAFAVEFIVMSSIVSNRLRYIKTHWLDLAIILLPAIAFFRVLRFGRLGRLLRLNQVSRVTRTAKAFRLRGLFLRVWRAILILEVIDRVIHRDIDKRLAQLRERLREQELACDELRMRIAELEAKRERVAESGEATKP
ncbi:MAG: hypothetical protein R3B90_22760 [Planctomycetaceae bacterium]